MATNVRQSGTIISPGPYFAKVVSHLDSTYMGSLMVNIQRGLPGMSTTESSNVIVRYCSPFMGSTSAEFEGNDSSSFHDVQKSYGFWMIPPDIGTTVIVMFIEGDINQGIWFGCMADAFQNHMIPGIAASKFTAMTPDDDAKYGTKNLPVAEYHKASRDLSVPNPDTFTRPVHPFAERLLQQGLLMDDVRGVTTSGARREVPSQVYGISTPGPIDTSESAPRHTIGFSDSGQVVAPVSRLGGTTFVMDDGDKDGKNELVRIRTRTGHQILLHNSSDLIYIANSKGSAWIELTSMGKIDVYAEDSVSIRTKGDFNLHADRDFNLEAGRNFNIAASEGNVNINASQNINLLSDEFYAGVEGTFDVTASSTIKLSTGGTWSATAGGELKLGAGGKLSAGGATVAIAASGESSISGSTMTMCGGRVNINTGSATSPTSPDNATAPTGLNLYSIPQRDASSGWSNGNYYKAQNILSIMQRVPCHEPWDQHENINPNQFSLSNTDATTDAYDTNPGANTPYPAKMGPANDRGRVSGKPFPWSTDQPFLTKVKQVAAALKFDPLDLLSVMNLESARSFDPSIRGGSNNKYVGLIQIGPSAASELGVSQSALVRMTRVQQMDYVLKYFQRNGWPSSKCPNPTMANIYLTVLLPARKYYSADQKVAISGDRVSGAWYKANYKTFDPQRRGFFTPRMVEAAIAYHKREVIAILNKAGTDTKTLTVKGK